MLCIGSQRKNAWVLEFLDPLGHLTVIVNASVNKGSRSIIVILSKWLEILDTFVRFWYIVLFLILRRTSND
jgi:hypothetical protein